MKEHTETRYCHSCFTEHPVCYVGGFPLVVCPKIPKGEVRLREARTQEEVGRIINIGEEAVIATYPPLVEYVLQYSDRGACLCGLCCDEGNDPHHQQPSGHTADVAFFKVCVKEGASASALRDLIMQHKGVFSEVNPLEGGYRDYIELGQWLGDQGIALRLMGLGSLLGIWTLITPRSIVGHMIPGEEVNLLARKGLVVIRAEAV